MVDRVSIPTPPEVIQIRGCTCDEEAPEHTHRYRLESQLGEGGMGIVFKAIDLDPPIWVRKSTSAETRYVALKFLNAESQSRSESEREQILARFHREAHTASELDHPNLVPVFNGGEDAKQRAFIAMELVTSTTALNDVICDAIDDFDHGVRRHPVTRKVQTSLIPPEKLIRLMKDILAGLEACHDKGIVHRDLKPENCLVMPDGTIRISDFGIAKVLTADESAKTHLRLTQSGDINGTPAYMAPEQIAGVPLTDPETDKAWGIGPWTDIRAFGAMVYEMVTGRLPFEAPSIPQLLSKVVCGFEPQPMSEFVTEINPALEEMILACLRQNPWERPQNVAEVRKLLKSVEKAFASTANARTAVKRADAKSASEQEVPDTVDPPSHESDSLASSLVPLAGGALVTAIIGSFLVWFFLIRTPHPVPETAVVSGETQADPVASQSSTGASIPPTPKPRVTTSHVMQVQPAASKRIPDLGPPSGDVLAKEFSEGVLLAERGNCFMAERKMLLVTVGYPNFPKPYLVRATCALRNGRIAEAKKNVGTYLEFDGVDPLPTELAKLIP